MGKYLLIMIVYINYFLLFCTYNIIYVHTRDEKPENV